MDEKVTLKKLFDEAGNSDEIPEELANRIGRYSRKLGFVGDEVAEKLDLSSALKLVAEIYVQHYFMITNTTLNMETHIELGSAIYSAMLTAIGLTIEEKLQ